MDVLLDRQYGLSDGRRVRLRLARSRDRDAVHALLASLGVESSDLEVRRALRCTPGRSLTVCATVWDGSRERLVGVGSLATGAEGPTLLAGDRALRALLTEGLRGNARAWVRRVA